MRPERRGQMPGNRATTQQDTLVRNLANELVELQRTTNALDHARPNTLDKPRSFTDADLSPGMGFTEVDRDAPLRPFQSGRQHRGADALVRFVYRGVGQADDLIGGGPDETWTSTVTGCPSTPTSVALRTAASTATSTVRLLSRRV